MGKKQKLYVLNQSKFLNDADRIKFDLRLQSAIHADTRNVLILLLLLRTGARVGEILALRRQDLEPSNRTIFIRGLKGSNDRELPLHSFIFRELYKYAQTCETERLFPIHYNTLRDAWLKYRTAEKPLHALRHTFAYYIYRRHKDVLLVKMALGHRSINNTMIYVDFYLTTKEMRRIIA